MRVRISTAVPEGVSASHSIVVSVLELPKINEIGSHLEDWQVPVGENLDFGHRTQYTVPFMGPSAAGNI